VGGENDFWLVLPTVLTVLSFIPAVIAERKGHSFVGFYVFGLVANVFAIAWSIIIPPNIPVVEARKRKEGYVRCPHCREFIRHDASACSHCTRSVATDLDGDARDHSSM
jgi:hypothetical protein